MEKVTQVHRKKNLHLVMFNSYQRASQHVIFLFVHLQFLPKQKVSFIYVLKKH